MTYYFLKVFSHAARLSIMASVKSLKKLRSASTAFLEDGGSLLHGVDSLLRDIQRTLAELEQRENQIIERELKLQRMEDEFAQAWSQRLLEAPATPSSPLPAAPAPTPADALPSLENQVQSEVAAIQSTVDQGLPRDELPPTRESSVTREREGRMRTPMMGSLHSPRRKKRRR